VRGAGARARPPAEEEEEEEPAAFPQHPTHLGGVDQQAHESAVDRQQCL
jgi:hypothetical protein